MLLTHSASFIIFVGIGAILILTGFMTYLRNKNDVLNRIFFGLTAAAAVWIISNHISSDPKSPYDLLLWSNRAVLIAGCLTLTLLLWFIIKLALWQKQRYLLLGITTANITVSALAATPLILTGVKVVNGQVINMFEPLSGLYFFLLFATTIFTGVVLFISRRKLKGADKIRVDTVATGLIVTAVIVMFGNAVLPMMGQYQAVTYAPLALIISIISMLYVIIKHKLFDIRFFVVRAVGYAITTVILAGVYVAPLIYVFMLIFRLPFIRSQFILAVILGTIAATNYQRMRHWFDEVSNRIFFHGNYDSAALFDELNKVLISTTQVNVLFNKVLAIIQRYLRPEFCYFLLDERPGVDKNHYGDSTDGWIALKEVQEIVGQSRYGDSDVVITEVVVDKEIRALLQAKEIALIARMNEKSGEVSSGYLVLGVRKGGDTYAEKDITVIETVVNTLSIALQNAMHYEEIQRFNETLQGKVDDATRQLRVTNEKLKQLDETKNEFISMASHQLRTPLTSVKGYVSMVLDGDVGPITEPQRELLNQSFVSSQRMANLISDLLNLSRINTGKFVIEATPVDLRTVVTEELKQLTEMAEGKQIDLVYDPPAQLPTLMLDENKTHQVVMNLIDNAIYYTPPGGKVTITLTETPEAVEFRVKDTGIGVPREAQKHLFGKMYRADNARRARPDGTGLGLFMAKKVVIAQGGAILFQSEEGKGSTFGFRFNKADHSVVKLKTRPMLSVPEKDKTPQPKEEAAAAE